MSWVHLVNQSRYFLMTAILYPGIPHCKPPNLPHTCSEILRIDIILLDLHISLPGDINKNYAFIFWANDFALCQF